MTGESFRRASDTGVFCDSERRIGAQVNPEALSRWNAGTKAHGHPRTNGELEGGETYAKEANEQCLWYPRS